MAEYSVRNAVLLVADVTASVELYERLGDVAAFATVAEALDRLRQGAERAGGQVVQSRGDDVLCAFANADAAAAAAAAMLDDAVAGEVRLHIAMHAGEAIEARASFFGDAVNVTYRLAAIANANEVLASAAAARLLSAEWRGRYRRLRAFRFKGKMQPIDVLAYHGDGALPMTQLPGHLLPAGADRGVMLRLHHGGETWELHEAESLSIGREAGGDLQFQRPWVSRHHAVLLVRDGLAMLTDRSSFGSFLAQNGAIELRVRRTSVTLSGAGVIALGTSHTQPNAECLEFSVERAAASPAHPRVRP